MRAAIDAAAADVNISGMAFIRHDFDWPHGHLHRSSDSFSLIGAIMGSDDGFTGHYLMLIAIAIRKMAFLILQHSLGFLDMLLILYYYFIYYGFFISSSSYSQLGSSAATPGAVIYFGWCNSQSLPAAVAYTRSTGAILSSRLLVGLSFDFARA